MPSRRAAIRAAVDVEADHRAVRPRHADRDRQADIAQADHGDLLDHQEVPSAGGNHGAAMQPDLLRRINAS